MGMLFQGSKIDLYINVSKAQLVDILTKNLEEHNSVFAKSMDGYRKTLIQYAEKNLKLAQDGKEPVYLRHPKPRSYAPQYERALGMLKISTEETVRLSAYDYARFVEDDWDWKDKFQESATAYVGATPL